MNYDFNNYKTEKFFDEMVTAKGTPRIGNEFLKDKIENLPFNQLAKKQKAAERSMISAGITFNVYSEDGGTERIIPIDVIPRVIDSSEWDNLEKGLIQRITALNLFLQDIYNEQKILKDGIIPREIIESSKGFLPECIGLTPPKKVWIHITGTDLIRDNKGVFTVLEDNLRCPSGVSYMLENRELSKQTFPDVLSQSNVRSISEYPAKLLEVLRYTSGRADPTVAVLTPGIYNSAYFEHSYLAQQMGVELVDYRDLVVEIGRAHV